MERQHIDMSKVDNDAPEEYKEYLKAEKELRDE